MIKKYLVREIEYGQKLQAHINNQMNFVDSATYDRLPMSLRITVDDSIKSLHLAQVEHNKLLGALQEELGLSANEMSDLYSVTPHMRRL